MIEENALVISINGKDIVIEPVKEAGCSGCKQSGVCGVSLFSRFFGVRSTKFHAINTSAVALRPGDEVVVGVHENALVSGSLVVYAIPLLLLVVAALAGGVLSDNWLPQHKEITTILASLSGLAAGLMLTHRISRRMSHDERYQPVILRRLNV